MDDWAGGGESASRSSNRAHDIRFPERRWRRIRAPRGDTHLTCQLTIQIVGLLLDGLTCLEQRPNHSHQLGTILDQFLGPDGKDIELDTAAGEGPPRPIDRFEISAAGQSPVLFLLFRSVGRH
jgi:hypothetical protein